MASRIITDISDFIFVEDTPEPADAIFLPGGTQIGRASCRERV